MINLYKISDAYIVVLHPEDSLCGFYISILHKRTGMLILNVVKYPVKNVAEVIF